MILLTPEEIGSVILTVYGQSNEELDCVGEIVAQAQLRKIIEWGEEMCHDHTDRVWPAEIGGGIVHRNHMKRRRCPECWQALKAEVEG